MNDVAKIGKSYPAGSVFNEQNLLSRVAAHRAVKIPVHYDEGIRNVRGIGNAILVTFIGFAVACGIYEIYRVFL
jgi:hypothetical protein